MHNSNSIRLTGRSIIVLMIFFLVFAFSAIDTHAAAKVKAPAKVTGASAKAAGETAVKVSWKKTKKSSGYAIYRDGDLVAKVKGAKKTSYIDSGLDPGTKYSYQVRAYKTYKAKSWFNKKTGKYQTKKPAKSIRGKAKKTTAYKYGKKSSVVSAKTSGAAPVGRRDASSLDAATLQDEMLRQINAQRSAAGVAPLQLDSRINALSQVKVRDMYSLGVLSHYSPNLGDFGDQLVNAGIGCNGWGENVAWGQRNITEVMNDWMNSPGHRSNILDADYTHVGVAYYGGFWVQQFVTNPESYGE